MYCIQALSGTAESGSKLTGVRHGQARWSRQCWAYRGQSHRTAAQAASGTVAATGKRSQGRRHRPGEVEQAGGNSSGRRDVELQVQRSGALAAVLSYGRG
jgi:hypothetical protein